MCVSIKNRRVVQNKFNQKIQIHNLYEKNSNHIKTCINVKKIELLKKKYNNLKLIKLHRNLNRDKNRVNY